MNAKTNVPIVVQKYGGSSLKDTDAIKRVAVLVKARIDEGRRVCVVVSAMGKSTDDLLARAKEISQNASGRELDMLLTCGERVSAALLAMALESLGVSAISFTGSQCGIITSDNHTDARILEVRPYRVQDELDRGKCVIVAGFQGVSYRKEITTLGRGGSDTTAVALAAALDASCEIYSDVDGVYNADPRVVADAKKIAALSYEEMEEFASAGAKVLNAQAVQFAKEKKIALFARKTGDKGAGTSIVFRKDRDDAKGVVRGVAHVERLIVLRSAHMRKLLSGLGEVGIETRQVYARDGLCEVVIDPENAHALSQVTQNIECTKSECGAVSLIGRGVLEDPTILGAALEACAKAPEFVSTSSYRITLFVKSEDTLELTRLLHAKFLNT